MVCDGVAVIGGDTGWQTFSPATGYESKSGTPGVRRIGSVVYVRGLIGPTSGSLPPSTQAVVATLPDGFRPQQSEWFASGTSSGQPPGTIVVTAAGQLQFRPPGVAVSYAGLSGIRFTVD